MAAGAVLIQRRLPFLGLKLYAAGRQPIRIIDGGFSLILCGGGGVTTGSIIAHLSPVVAREGMAGRWAFWHSGGWRMIAGLVIFLYVGVRRLFLLAAALTKEVPWEQLSPTFTAQGCFFRSAGGNACMKTDHQNTVLEGGSVLHALIMELLFWLWICHWQRNLS